MTPVLSPRERAAVLFIHGYVDTHGHSPSLDEIADHIGVAHRAAAHYVIRRLRLAGIVATAPVKQARSFKLADNVVVHRDEIYIAVETDA